MEYAIYQIDSKKDKERVRFEDYERTIDWVGKVDPGIYKEVWRDQIRRTMPEKIERFLNDIYYVFNEGRRPEGYKGISMSVSDVIVVGDRAYFVDSFGFQPISAEGFVV